MAKKLIKSAKEIIEWINNGTPSMDKDSNFRKNILVLFTKCIAKYFALQDYTTIEMTTADRNAGIKDTWVPMGVIYQGELDGVYEHVDVGPLNVTARFFIDIKTMEGVIKEFENELPGSYILEDELRTKLKEPSPQEWIQAMEKCLNNKELCGDTNQQETKCEIIFKQRHCPVACVGKLAFAIANGNKDGIFHPYVFLGYGRYKKFFEEAQKLDSVLSSYELKCDDTNSNKSQKGNNVNQTNSTEIAELLEDRKQIILQGPPGTGKTRVAKIIAINMLGNSNIDNGSSNEEIKKAFDELSENVTLIQFHPSYSYEDFVRGITAKSTGTQIEYIVENKILAHMAQSAKKAWDDAKEKTDAEKFILIIDEINRANLSSVLGELIYALEYRDEAVESMYALEKDNENKPIPLAIQRQIILPSNLYIIGTMNTADRSIGHMDYAIRRRFSFETILPNKEVADDKKLFEEVETIFEKHISPEFKVDDVMLGHSYFIGDVHKKLKYQILPLLKEYVKDGVLNESAMKSIEELVATEDSK